MASRCNYQARRDREKMWRCAFDVPAVRRGWRVLSEKFNFLAEKLPVLLHNRFQVFPATIAVVHSRGQAKIYSRNSKWRGILKKMWLKVWVRGKTRCPETRSLLVYGALRRNLLKEPIAYFTSQLISLLTVHLMFVNELRACAKDK